MYKTYQTWLRQRLYATHCIVTVASYTTCQHGRGCCFKCTQSPQIKLSVYVVVKEHLKVLWCWWTANTSTKFISCKKHLRTFDNGYLIIWGCFTKEMAHKSPYCTLNSESSFIDTGRCFLYTTVPGWKGSGPLSLTKYWLYHGGFAGSAGSAVLWCMRQWEGVRTMTCFIITSRRGSGGAGCDDVIPSCCIRSAPATVYDMCQM
jgi:hypothetical protein